MKKADTEFGFNQSQLATMRNDADRLKSALPLIKEWQKTMAELKHNKFEALKAAGVKKGSGTPNTEKVGKVNRQQLEEIATTKMPDLTAADMDAAVRTVAGTARSMGIETEGVN